MEDYSTGLLAENQTPNTPPDSPNGASVTYQPDEEERKTLKLVNGIFSKNKNARKRYDANWIKYYKFFRGKQWLEQRPAYRNSEVFNFVMQTIRSQVPIITDARQRIEFTPENPMDRDFAEILNEVAEADWDKNNWSYVLTELLYDSHIYGTAIAEVGNQDLNKGFTGATFQSKDMFYAFPDPSSYNVNDNSNNFVYAEPMDISIIKRRYPDKAQFIKADLSDLMQNNKADLGPLKFMGPTDIKVANEGDITNDLFMKDQALLITCWLKCDEYIETQSSSSDPLAGDQVPQFEQRLKYPNGRKIVICNNIVLEDIANPYEDGKFPYVLLRNACLPREYYGISEIEPLEGPQKIFNKVMSFALDVLTLMGNPIWIVDTNAEIDTDNLFSRPGLVLEPSPGTRVERVEGVQLQPYVLEIADKVRTYIDSISGANDVTRGVQPEGVTAASAIAKLQDAAQVRIREKSRFLDMCLQEVGQMYLSRQLQFTPAPRIIRITNNQNATKYFKMSVTEMKNEDGSTKLTPTGDVQRQANISYYIQNTDTGQISEGPEQVYQINGKFDIKVSTGSGLGFEKDRKFNMAQVLFDRGALDQVELLKAADWPDYEAVWQKVQERQQQQAAQQQQQGPPPKG